VIDLRDIHLPRRTEAVATARAVVGELAAWLGPRSEDAKLLVSELVTNALKYGDGNIQLTISGHDAAARFVVCDEGEATGPQLRARPDRDGGWGLHLVDRVADRWGVVPRTSHVWFELQLL